MLSWPALLLAPAIALTDLTIAYALVSPSCAHQNRGGLHAVAVVSVLAVLALTAMAWQAWRHQASASNASRAGGPALTPGVTAADGDGLAQRPSFIALMAVLVGGLSLLVCVALWLPIWMLSPCY
jgi:hypothetical protein